MKVPAVFMDFWRKALRIGLTDTMSEQERMHLFMLNGFSFVLGAFVLLFNIVFPLVGWYSGWGNLVFVLLVSAVIFLNAIHHFKLARFTMVFLSFFVILAMALWRRHTGQEYAFIAVMCNSVLFYRSPRIIGAAFLTGIAGFVLYFWIDHTQPFTPDPEVPYTLAQLLSLSIFVCAILTQSLIFHSAFRQYSEKLHAANEEINANMEELSSINNHLDEIVKEKSKELRSYTDAIDVSIFSMILGDRYEILRVNNYFLEVSGYTEDELINRPVSVLDSGYHGPAFFKGIASHVKSGRIWQGEVRGSYKNGQVFWVEMVIKPMWNDNGDIRRLLILALPITDRKTAEEERKETVRMLESIAFRTSHNVRGPLARIMGLANLISADMIKYDEVKDITEKINTAAFELDMVTRDLTSYINDHEHLKTFLNHTNKRNVCSEREE